MDSLSYTIKTTWNNYHFGLSDRYEIILGSVNVWPKEIGSFCRVK